MEGRFRVDGRAPKSEPPGKRQKVEEEKGFHVHRFVVEGHPIVIRYPEDLVDSDSEDDFPDAEKSGREFFHSLFREIDALKETEQFSKIFRRVVPGTVLGSVGFEADFDEYAPPEVQQEAGVLTELDEEYTRWFGLGCDRGMLLNYQRFFSSMSNMLDPKAPEWSAEELNNKTIDAMAKELGDDINERMEAMTQVERQQFYDRVSQRLQEENKALGFMDEVVPSSFFCMEGTVRVDRPVWVIDLREVPSWNSQRTYAFSSRRYHSFASKYVSGLDGFVAWDTFSFFHGYEQFHGKAGEILLVNPSQTLVNIRQSSLSIRDIAKRGLVVAHRYFDYMAMNPRKVKGVDPIPLE